MALLVGDKSRFAIEIGEWAGGILRRMDVWLAGQWLTCDDDWAFVRQIVKELDALAGEIRFGAAPTAPYPGLSATETHRRLAAETEYEVRRRYRILEWGPTTDNIKVFWFREEDRLTITASFWRERHLERHPEHVGAVFVGEMEAAELGGIIEEVAGLFHREPQQPA